MLSHKTIHSLLHSAVRNTVSHIPDFTLRPGKDFTRNRKFPADKLISFLVTQGAASTRVELLDFFTLDASIPTSSAFRQQRAKLKPEALADVFLSFNSSFSSSRRFSADNYFVSEGQSAKGYYSLHINAFYDLDRNMYTSALLQPVHKKTNSGRSAAWLMPPVSQLA